MIMDASLENTILDFLDGKLTPKQEKSLLNQLQEAGIEDDLESLKSIAGDLGALETPEPGPGLNRKFYHMLEDFRNREAQPFLNRVSQWLHDQRLQRYTVRFAYTAAFLIIGWIAGRTMPGRINPEMSALSTEVSQMKKMMTFSMLNQSSVAERIRAVHYMKSLASVDEDVVHALIQTVNSDDNVNVRLVALETLLNVPRSESVRSGLMHALLYQESPLMQLTLVNAVLDSNDPDMAEPLRIILARKDLHYIVRQRIESGLTPLS